MVVERLSLAFDEDPVSYFSKRKDGRGHIFIDLIDADDRKDVNFSPYNVIKVGVSLGQPRGLFGQFLPAQICPLQNKPL
jgi:hypothetical protein